MGPVIWGFDLSKLSWAAFGHKRMFDGRWYLRSERFVVYQIAMLTGLAAECTATYSLSKYQNLKRHLEQYTVPSSAFSSTTETHAILNQSNIINAAISTIVLCVFVATLFGADFFFLLFWPERVYPTWYSVTKRALAVIITAGMGASAIASTWVIAGQHAVLSDVNDKLAAQLLQLYYRPPLVYNQWAQNIAWVVLLWIAFVGTIGSTLLMFLSATHDEKYGPLARGRPSRSEKDEDNEVGYRDPSKSDVDADVVSDTRSDDNVVHSAKNDGDFTADV